MTRVCAAGNYVAVGARTIRAKLRDAQFLLLGAAAQLSGARAWGPFEAPNRRAQAVQGDEANSQSLPRSPERW